MESLLLLVGLVLAALALSGPIAFGMAFRLRERLAAAERQLARLEHDLRPAASNEQGAVAAVGTVEKSAAGPVQAAPVSDGEWGLPPPLPKPAAAAPTPARAVPPARAVSPVAPPPPPPSKGLEQLVGTNWTVRLGGVALALGGLLLVRYSVEQGLVGPAVRCALGLVLAIALAGAGEWLRRKEKISGSRTPTPAVLTAAATVVAFGAIYAAHALYGFIGPAVAFVTLGIIAVVAILGAALHGPALAGVGLLGAFVAPLIVSSAQPNPWPVVPYLVVTTGAAYALSRVRRWLWLACAASIGAAAWAVIFSVDNFVAFFHAGLVHVLLSTVLAAIFIAFLPSLESSDEDAAFDPVSTLVLGMFALAVVVVLWNGIAFDHFDLPAILVPAAIVAGLAFLSITTPATAAALPIAAALVVATLGIWPGDPDKPIPLSTLLTLAEPLQRERFSLFALFGALVVGVSGARTLLLAPPRDLRLTGIYAATAVAAPLLILAEVWLRLARTEASLPFTALAGLLAIAFVYLAHRVRDGAHSDARLLQRVILGAFATGALAAVALGLVFLLDGGMLTVALALSCLAAAGVSARLGVDGLRWAVAAMGFVVLGRVAWEPRIVSALGTTPIFNWLLIGYGVPALAFAGAARLMRVSGGEDLPVRVAQSLAILFSALLVFFEIRHGLNAGNICAPRTGFVEAGLQATMAILLSLALTRLDLRGPSMIFRLGSLLFGTLSGLVALFGLLVAANPLFTCEPVVGNALVNTLLLGYALPAVGAALLARQSLGRRPAWFTTGAGASSVTLLFAYATLETRRFFHEPSICLNVPFETAEIWAYSAVWLALGLLLLLYGIVRRLEGARLASALFVFLATLKIFLYDMANLEGLARALSVLGLGIVLIAIGLLYQKFVFRTMFTRSSAATDPT